MSASYSLFLSYNPKQDAEYNTALRLQTLGNLYGLTISLPARLHAGNYAAPETKERIEQAQLVVALCLGTMSKQMQAELGYAIEQKKTIVVLYKEGRQKPIDFQNYENVEWIAINYQNTDETLSKVANFLRSKAQVLKQNKEAKDAGVALGIIGLGLSLLALWALSSKK